MEPKSEWVIYFGNEDLPTVTHGSIWNKNAKLKDYSDVIIFIVVA